MTVVGNTGGAIRHPEILSGQDTGSIVGMIGSKKKIHILYRNLMKKGVSKEVLERVHAPIGLDINSETPEEIAVSIVAQLIQVRGEPG